MEDWICPTAVLHSDTRKRNSQNQADGVYGDQGQTYGSPSTHRPGVSKLERKHNASGGAIPIHLILIIVGSLLALLIVVGFVSYYKAIKS